MSTADSLRFQLIEHVLLVVHADFPASDGDWQRLVLVRNASRQKIRGTLVVAPPRGSINAAQRADVAAFLKDTGSRIAVLTDSALIRGVALAVGLIGFPVRAFTPSSLPGALDYVQFPAGRHAEVTRLIESLEAQLSPPKPPTRATA